MDSLDKHAVDLFLEDAGGIFETAMAAAAADASFTEVAILLDSNRAIRVVDAAGWQLDSLRADYGATTVYRVARGASGVFLEGRSGQRSCRLRTEQPNITARTLLHPQTPRVAPQSRPPLGVSISPQTAEIVHPAIVVVEHGKDSNQHEKQRALYGFLHASARAGT